MLVESSSPDEHCYTVLHKREIVSPTVSACDPARHFFTAIDTLLCVGGSPHGRRSWRTLLGNVWKRLCGCHLCDCSIDGLGNCYLYGGQCGDTLCDRPKFLYSYHRFLLSLMHLVIEIPSLHQFLRRFESPEVYPNGDERAQMRVNFL